MHTPTLAEEVTRFLEEENRRYTPIARFLTDWCELGDEFFTPRKDAWQAYANWLTYNNLFLDRDDGKPIFELDLSSLKARVRRDPSLPPGWTEFPPWWNPAGRIIGWEGFRLKPEIVTPSSSS